MAGSYTQQVGFLTINDMMQDVVSKMITAGFELVYPAAVEDLINPDGNYNKDILGLAKEATKKRWCAILKATDIVNVSTQVNDTQPWLIKFEWDKGQTHDGMIDIIVGTPSQFNTTTGAHTFYTAKYMGIQKREIVVGDPTKTDPAFDYKEVLGIVGTAFRNSKAVITNPDFVVLGSRSTITDITAGPAGGQLSNYPKGETDLVINYASFSSSVLSQMQGINPNNVFSNYSSLFGAAGGASSAIVAYKSDFDINSSARYEVNTHVNYKDNTYRVTSVVSKVSDLKIHELTIEDIKATGIPSSTITNKRFWIDGNVYRKTALTAKKINAYPGSHNWTGSSGSSANYDTWFILGDQLIKTVNVSSGTNPFNITIPPDTVINSSNADTYKISNYYDLDFSIAAVATQFELALVQAQPIEAGVTVEEALDLSSSTASLYNMVPASDLSSVYAYDSIENRLYEVLYLNDTIGTAATPVTTFPTNTSPFEFTWGAYTLKYVGKYTDFVAASTLSSSYYDTFEGEDSAGYNTKISDGDFSSPAIRRNRNRSSKMFYNREHIKLDEIGTYPMGYTLVATNRGFVFSVHEETSDEVGNRNSWIIVQRPVDHVSGEVYATGKAPVHCMYSIMSKLPNKPWMHEDMLRGTIDYGYSIKKTPTGTGVDLFKSNNYTIYIPAPEAVSVRRFVVRESDITAPYPTHVYVKNAFGVNMDYALGGFPFGTPADQHTPDYNAVINAKQQVAISEGNKYVITFPNGFNTSRYAYTHEMDLLAYTSADVISAGTEIEITAYGETRTYIALHANGPNNTGMRILVLKQGGGIE